MFTVVLLWIAWRATKAFGGDFADRSLFIEAAIQ